MCAFYDSTAFKFFSDCVFMNIYTQKLLHKECTNGNVLKYDIFNNLCMPGK